MLALAAAVAACHSTNPATNPAAPSDLEDTGDDDPEDPADALPPVSPPSTAPSSPRQALLAEAHRELGAVVESHYAHRTHVSEATGVFDYDCSGFVGYALAHAAPEALHTLVDATTRRPLARHFEAFFTAPRAPWTPVERAADLVPGDLIAWLEPPAKHSRNTGHVMIVDRPPRPGTRRGELVIAVIDSSHAGHGAADARNRDHRNGLGAGEIILITDATGRPTGYRWSLSRHSVAYATQIALGHLP
jgi:hypothetical protein